MTERNTFPAWTGTNASARQIADLIQEVDEYASVETEVVGVSYAGGNVRLVIDTVPNVVRLQAGDAPVFDGERWTVDESGRVKP